MRRMPEVAGRVVPGEGGDRAADGPRVFMAKEISPVPCSAQGTWKKHNNNKQGVMMMSEKVMMEPTAGSGAFFTNENVLKEDAEMVKPRETPLDPNAPEMVRGENVWHPLEIPECGIDFKRYHSPDCEVYICAWQNKNNAIGHVYEIRLRRTDDGWRAVLSNDGRKLCSLAATGRHLAYLLALGAMRAYLRRGHRKTIMLAKKAAAALADVRSDAAGAVDKVTEAAQ